VADFQVRSARPEDAPAMAALFAAVATERDGIASEPPIDVAERTVVFARSAASTMVAEAGDGAAGDGGDGAAGQVIGMLHVEASRHGYGDLGMLVDRAWRGRGVGSALLAAAADWARQRGLHKLCLEVFAHNAAAIAAYRKAGYAEEGRRVAQYRRASGELWDTIMMGLLL
jgi:RimJ/RimL family protein N-acetyltransferase